MAHEAEHTWGEVIIKALFFAFVGGFLFSILGFFAGLIIGLGWGLWQRYDSKE